MSQRVYWIVKEDARLARGDGEIHATHHMGRVCRRKSRDKSVDEEIQAMEYAVNSIRRSDRYTCLLADFASMA